jgi:hypothetical protein
VLFQLSGAAPPSTDAFTKSLEQYNRGSGADAAYSGVFARALSHAAPVRRRRRPLGERALRVPDAFVGGGIRDAVEKRKSAGKSRTDVPIRFTLICWSQCYGSKGIMRGGMCPFGCIVRFAQSRIAYRYH